MVAVRYKVGAYRGMWREIDRIAGTALRWKFANWTVAVFLALAGIMLAIEQFALTLLFLALTCALCGRLWWVSDHVKRSTVTANKRRKKLEPSFTLRISGLVGLIVVWAFVAYLIRGYAHRKELEGLYGKMFPGFEPTPAGNCRGSIPEGAIRLFLGDNEIIATRFPHRVLAIAGIGNVISLDRAENGTVSVLMEVKDEKGTIAVRLDKTGFAVNPKSTYKLEHPDRSTVIVKDSHGGEALNVHYLNPSAITLNGTLRYPGRGAIPLQIKGLRESCLGPEGGGDTGAAGIDIVEE